MWSFHAYGYDLVMSNANVDPGYTPYQFRRYPEANAFEGPKTSRDAAVLPLENSSNPTHGLVFVNLGRRNGSRFRLYIR